jgi:hypothetical protein
MSALAESLPKLNATVKARIALDQKRALEAIALARQLRTPDIVREALRFYLSHVPRIPADPASFFLPNEFLGNQSDEA